MKQKDIKERRQARQKRREIFSDLCMVLIMAVGLCDIARHVALGAWPFTLTMIGIQVFVFLFSVIARESHQPWWMLLPGVGTFILFWFFMNNWATTRFNSGLLVTAILCLLWAIVGTVRILAGKDHLRPFPFRLLGVTLAWALLFLAVWGLSFFQARNREGGASREIWGVPAQWDTACGAAEGTVEEFFYETHAYATDGREVTKSVLVYLPAGYDKETPYNILYLMHGTGDDQYYWLQTNPYNKTMLDNLIAAGEIGPLIVVTPTFYCEEDCKESVAALESLTYAFEKELRNDLMPAVESTYSTYAASADEEGFIESRDHRAFAGLSRGAVTTYHSVFCKCLDYFSYFGTFSGSRTDASYFQENLQSEAFAHYPIHYLYVSSGTFDFALPRQLMDYKGLLEVEERLEEGFNTCFDIFPMRYHSMGDWHLALYNFLQKVF